MSRLGFSAIMFLFISFWITKTEVLPADRPEESITYWKPFEILTADDPKVEVAEEIFNRLLLGWEETRVAPELHVVRSDQGPWAASLDDGNILLSREAIDLSWKGGEKYGRDRLAFVLAHELSHQRADHLWHRRFFRLAGQQAPKVQGRMLGGMRVDQLEREGLEAKEVQADREGLLLMAMVGFDPQNVLADEGRFFYEWIENIWGLPCETDTKRRECLKTKKRFEQVRVHWQEAARQALLFELGVQSYVSGHYEIARKYFTAYGRQFPGREVHNNIGLTHVGEAMMIRKALLEKGENLGTEFVYPTVLEETSGVQIPLSQTREGMRSLGSGNIELRREMEQHLNKAIASFERAIKIDPGHRPAHWNLISSYLLSGNAPLAYGATAGTYVKRFGRDAAAAMFLGIAAHFEGDNQKGRLMFDQALETGEASLMVGLRKNRAAFFRAIGDKKGEKGEWKKLADLGRKRGDEGLFKLALMRMRNKTISPPPSKPGEPEEIGAYVIAQHVPPFPIETEGLKQEEIWLEGERIELNHFENGVRMALDSSRHIIALWQTGGDAKTAAGIAMGHDMAKVGRAYGLSSRQVRTLQGEYWAYDAQQIVFRFVDDKVAGWFVYEKK